MEIDVDLTTDPIPYPAWQWPDAESYGALAEFYGVVRGSEDGAPIGGLRYEAYASMALTTMRRLLEELAQQHPCEAARVVHRHGDIRVGEAAIYIGVRSPHRTEAFAMLSQFMDRLKQDVPIWKTDLL